MKSLAVIIALCAIAFIGCETTKGAGKDMEQTGKNIQQGINSSTSNATDGNSAGMGAGMNDNQSQNAFGQGATNDMGGY